MSKLLSVLVFLVLFFIPANAIIQNINFTVPDDKLDHAITGFFVGRALTQGLKMSNLDAVFILSIIAIAKEIDDDKGDMGDIFATVAGTFIAIDFTF